MLQSAAHPCAISRRWPRLSAGERAERSRRVVGPGRGSLIGTLWQSCDPEERLVAMRACVSMAAAAWAASWAASMSACRGLAAVLASRSLLGFASTVEAW